MVLPKVLTETIDTLRQLPGVGPKSAQRMVFYLMQNNRNAARKLAESLREALETVRHCQKCRNFSQNPLCDICLDQTRETKRLCVVVQPSDLIAIEKSGIYRGNYFVLMGLISPIERISPQDIGMPLLKHIVEDQQIEEIILALSMTVEGESTSHYIQSMLSKSSCKITRIAQGIPQGGELEYIDNTTLVLAIKDRRLYS